jgi:hypothetical protein
VAGAPGEPIFSLSRPFNWGGIFVMDSTTADIPARFGPHGLVRSPTCLGVVVRHAQDVDTSAKGPFEVKVEVRWGPPDGDLSIVHQIGVPSGAVTIGNAEAEEVIPVAGSCIVSVALDDDSHAENVTIWLTPAG